MRLNRLQLENWCTHQSLDIDLSGGLQIEGRNGTGKSSILEAIRFMFKETARGYAGRITNGQRHASVKLTFEADTTTYTVEKRIYLDKPSTASMTAGHVQVADNPSSVYLRLKNILPEEVLDRLLYIPQGGLTGILERLSGKDGKLEMDRLFGLDRLERVWEKTGTEIQETEIKAKFISDELKKYPDNAGEELDRAVGELEAAVQRAKDGILSSTKKLDETRALLEGAEEEIKKSKEKKQKTETLNREKNKLTLEEAKNRKEDETTQERIKRMEERKKELQKLKTEKNGLEKYSKIRETLSEFKAVEDRLKQTTDLGEKKERINELLNALKDLTSTELQSQQTKEDLKRAERENTALETNLKTSAEHYRQLTKLGGHPKCPTCGQHINAFVLDKETRETADKIKALEEQRLLAAERIVSLAKADKILAEKIVRLKDAGAEIRHLDLEVKEKEVQSTKLAATRESLKGDLERLGYGGETHQSVESKYADFNRIGGQIRSIEDETSEAPRLAEKGRELSDKLDLSRRMITSLDAEISAIGYDEEAERRLAERKSALQETNYRTEADIRALDSELKMAAEASTEAGKKRSSYLKLKEQHSSITEHINLLKAAREVFHRDKGIARFIRETYLQRLNSMLTYHFKKFNQNPRYLDVKFDKDYEITLQTTNGAITVQQLSGGEMAQLALSLRIALIDLMSPIRLLILDEPFGSLDESHRELLGESLNKIAQQGQVILVTHVRVDSLQLPNRIDLGGY